MSLVNLNNLRIEQLEDLTYVVRYERDEGGTYQSQPFNDVREADTYVEWLRKSAAEPASEQG